MEKKIDIIDSNSKAQEKEKLKEKDCKNKSNNSETKEHKDIEKKINAMLNEVINEAISVVQPPTDKGKRLKIMYATQSSTKPPTFVIFVNNKELFHFSYQRYLVNQIRSTFGLEGTPIRIIIRERIKEDK